MDRKRVCLSDIRTEEVQEPVINPEYIPFDGMSWITQKNMEFLTYLESCSVKERKKFNRILERSCNHYPLVEFCSCPDYHIYMERIFKLPGIDLDTKNERYQTLFETACMYNILAAVFLLNFPSVSTSQKTCSGILALEFLARFQNQPIVTKAVTKAISELIPHAMM